MSSETLGEQSMTYRTGTLRIPLRRAVLLVACAACLVCCSSAVSPGQEPIGPATVMAEPAGWEPFHFRAEYLLWWTRDTSVPPLVTTSPAVDRLEAGVLGEPGTEVLFGGNMNGRAQSGVRFLAGYWFTEAEVFGIEASYFGLGTQTDGFFADQNDYPVLARPFFDVEAGAEASELVAYPGILAGSIAATVATRLEGGEIVLRHAIYRDPWTHWDVIAGFRGGRLHDSVGVWAPLESLNTDSGLAVGTTVDQTDFFDASNVFRGAQIGLLHRSQRGRLGLDLALKVALGSTRSEVNILGSTTTTVGDLSDTRDTGLLALSTNSGNYRSHEFTAIPELDLNLTVDLTRRLRATFGYTIFYWNNVARSGEQIDRSLNLSQLPPDEFSGEARPAFVLNKSGFWAQGLSFGLFLDI